MLEFITENQGIFGAVFGTVATLITTHLLKSVGRVKVELLDIKLNYTKFDNRIGTSEPAQGILDAEEVKINFNIKCYNSSEVPRILDNLEVICYSDSKKPLFTGVLSDTGTHKSNGYFVRYDELFFINIPPKEGVLKSTHIIFKSKDDKKLNDIKSIKLKYKDKRIKNKRIVNYS
ncbi:hypothetical protein [Oceanobacillus massiliensis]|uniref:hypothetical protein n=1 Tax=Oceanobacillus massiliensis TaxID=1465765 RepID=UPI003016E5F6